MSFIDFGTILTRSDAWLPAADVLLKVTLLLGAAGLASLALARASAAVRHLIWTIALTSALVLPVLSIALPRWQLPIVTIATPAQPAVDPIPGRDVPKQPETVARAPRLEAARTAPATAREPGAPVVPDVAARTAPALSAAALLLAVWAIGAAAVVSRLLVGIAAVQWMRRRSTRVVDAPWLPLAIELASELGISRRLTFLESPNATMPMAFGMVKPAVLMPADAVHWPIERLRIVLLHELAHVKRRDCLTHAIAQLACAVHWFNPLSWVAARHVRTERERACDDLVLACGTRGSDYAEELLEIARVMRAGRFPALITGATLAMAHRSQLEGRLIAILDPRLPRSGVSRLRTALAAATVACALPPLATLEPYVIAKAAPAPTAPLLMTAAPRPEREQRPQPTPQPTPATAPRPDPGHAGADVSVQASAQAAVRTLAQAAAQGAVHGAIEGAASSMESAIEKAVEGALEGVAGLVAQEGKRAASDPRTIAALTAALKDSDKEVRQTALQVLVRLRDPSVFEALVQALKDAAHDVREQAAFGLGQMHDKRAVDPLILALKDENPGVREQATFALGQLRDPRSVDALIAALQDPAANVRGQAAFALGQLREKRAAAALNALVKDADGQVREQAVFALGQLKDVVAVEGLIVALRDTKPDVRQQAAFALGQIRDARAVSPLISALKDEHADVRKQAAFSLGHLRDRSAVEALVVALKDPAADVREQVAFALGQLRDPRAIDPLTNALKDQSAQVRQQAAFALGQLIR